MPKVVSKVKSTSSMPQFIKKVRALESNVAEAGYDNTPHKETGTPMAEVALANEEGWGITQRPFMTQASELMEVSVNRHSYAAMDALYRDYAVREVLMDLAEEMADDIREVIERGHFVITNNETPLIDTGDMISSTKAFVERKEDY